MVDRVEFSSDAPIDPAITPERGEESGTKTTNEVLDEAPNVLDPSRPDWLPEKFSTAEDLAQAYVELERKQSSESGGEADGADGEGEVPAGLNSATLNQYSEKYYSEEGLTETDYTELANLGVSRDLVSQYAAGMAALQEQTTNAIYAEAGGSEESFKGMLAWAERSLGENEKSAFNAVMQGQDVGAKQMTVRGLYARYGQMEGREATLVQGSTTTSGEGGFQSTAQLTAAMNDPRYQKDHAYRQQVIRKLQNSQQF